jgi:thioredoxin reductase
MTISRRTFIASGAWLGIGALATGKEAFGQTTEDRPSEFTPEQAERSHDVIVVGGSYAGLSAALQLARIRLRVLVVDAGLPRNRFARSVRGFLGQDGRTPEAILSEATRQLLLYPTVQKVSAMATQAQGEEGRFTVTLSGGQEHTATRLVLATGVKDELPPIPGVQDRWGVTVLHCPYCHGHEVRDRQLGVLASHPVSPYQGTLVPDWGPTTYFTQGREPSAEEIAFLTARGVSIERSPVMELLGEAPELEAVRLKDGRVMALGALFTIPKTTLASPLAEKLGCEIEEGPVSPSLVIDTMNQTTVPGVFAAGDITTSMQKVALAVSTGVTAGVGVHRSLVQQR